MPQEIHDCVQKVKKTVKPRDPKQTKEEAAWAICTDTYNKKKNKRKKSSVEESAANIRNIAQQIETRDAQLSQRLLRIAQVMENNMPISMPPMALPMASGGPKISVDATPSGTTPIESFHKPIRNVRTHKITMTFEAPHDMSEGDIMDTFFKIMPDSGLQPLNFSWADATPSRDGVKTK